MAVATLPAGSAVAVRLPTALPYAFSGLQVGAATCILAAIVAESVTTGTGLGYLIVQAGVQFDVG